MTKLDKLLPNRIRNNPKAVTFEELRTLLEAYGFELLRVAGSHYVFLVEINGIERTFRYPTRDRISR